MEARDILLKEIKADNSELFVGRKEQIRLFFDFYNQFVEEIKEKNNGCRVDNNYVLQFYGIGGIGKSMLLKEIKRELDKRHSESSNPKAFIYGSFDFNGGGKDKITCIKSIMHILTQKSDFFFPLTELALLKIARDSGDDFHIRKETINDRIKDSKTLRIFFSVIKWMPVVGEFSNKVLETIGMFEDRDDSESIISFIKKSASKNKDLIEYVNSASLDTLASNLQLFFSIDLEMNLEDSDYPLVLFFDTYEHYVNLTQYGFYDSKSNDLWLRDNTSGLISTSKKIMFVISGRDPLSDNEITSEAIKKYKSDWSKIGIKEVNLKDLPREYTFEYLTKIGVKDEQFMQRVYEISNGVPVVLDYFRKIFEKYEENTTEQYNINNYGTSNIELISRYIQLMPPNMIDMVEAFSFIDGWDDKLVCALSSVIPSYSDELYKQMKIHSFVYYDYNEKQYKIHRIVKNILQDLAKESGRQYNELINALRKYYLEKDERVNFDKAIDYLSNNYENSSLDSIYYDYQEIISPVVKKYIRVGNWEKSEYLISEFIRKNSTYDLSKIMTLMIKATMYDEEAVHIATKPMTEQYILGEMLCLLIESAGYKTVLTKGILGGTKEIHPRLIKGEFDLYPEYTSSGWVLILNHESGLYGEVKIPTSLVAEYESKYDLKWIGCYGFNNTYTIAIKKEIATKYSLTKISDLVTCSDKIVFGANSDYLERPDGVCTFETKYSLKFLRKDQLEIGARYKALNDNKVDAINSFTTDAQGEDINKIVLLKDDLNTQANYYCSTVVRKEALVKYPLLEDILMKMNNTITNQDMRKLNYEVEILGESEKEVARKYLRNKNII